MRLRGRIVIALQLMTEDRVQVGAAVDERSGDSVDDGCDVVPGDRLVRLQRVRDREDLGPVVRQQPVGLVVQQAQLRVDLFAELGVE